MIWDVTLAGIGERAEHVEDGADADLPARPDGVLHGQVHHGREEKADADLLDAFFRAVRGHLDVDAQRLEHVGAAALARDRPVAVLGHGHARAGDDEGGGRGDVERMRHVAAGAAGVDLVFARRA